MKVAEDYGCIHYAVLALRLLLLLVLLLLLMLRLRLAVQTLSVIFYFRFLGAVLVIVTLQYELCKVITIHYAVTLNTNPSHCGNICTTHPSLI